MTPTAAAEPGNMGRCESMQASRALSLCSEAEPAEVALENERTDIDASRTPSTIAETVGYGCAVDRLEAASLKPSRHWADGQESEEINAR